MYLKKKSMFEGLVNKKKSRFWSSCSCLKKILALFRNEMRSLDVAVSGNLGEFLCIYIECRMGFKGILGQFGLIS